MANNPTLDEIADRLITEWYDSAKINEGPSIAVLRYLIINALKQRDSKVIASVTDALSKVLYER